MKHVVQFSGGVGSWAAAKRVADKYGTADMTLLFADTMIEDEDLYRFLDEAAANIGAPLVRIADGRTPWEVFKDEKFIANTRVDLCSRILKRDLLDKWVIDNCDPKTTVLHFGIDWTEQHRFDGKHGKAGGVKARMKSLGFESEAPMCEKPWYQKHEMLALLRAEGIEPPRLYSMGFPHNNCGGFCVKAGQAQFKLLLETMPERYAEHERQEEELRAIVGDYSVMKDRTGGESKALTMKAFRERIESRNCGQLDLFEWGGCGCAVD